MHEAALQPTLQPVTASERGTLLLGVGRGCSWTGFAGDVMLLKEVLRAWSVCSIRSKHSSGSTLHRVLLLKLCHSGSEAFSSRYLCDMQGPTK